MVSLGRTYFDIAIGILKEERRPMTAREITELALTKFLITAPGKTPEASMSGSQIRRPHRRREAGDDPAAGSQEVDRI